MTGLTVANDDCWNRIGVAGDGSCPELATHVHCRNCPVYADAARQFFERQAPDGYLEGWTRDIAGPEEAIDRDRASLAVFRLADEWLAIHIGALIEVTPPRPVHRIPHRGNAVLQGLVNVRGQLRLFVSLHGLLGIDAGPAWWREPAAAGARGRYVVAQIGADSWVFPADEVAGVYRISRSQMRNVGPGRSSASHQHAQAIFTWREKTVAFLDEQRVARALREVGS